MSDSKNNQLKTLEGIVSEIVKFFSIKEKTDGSTVTTSTLLECLNVKTWYDFIVKSTEYYNKNLKEKDLQFINFLLSVYEKNDLIFIDESKYNCRNKDIAFVLFYIACLYWYRKNKPTELHSLLEKHVGSVNHNRQFSFDEYPVIWDLAVRLCTIQKDYDMVRKCALAGSRVMPENTSCNIAYVDCVCSWLKDVFYESNKEKDVKLSNYIEENLDECKKEYEKQKKIFDKHQLDEEDVIIAIEKNIKAINSNPKYGKYYYYLAQICFYYRYAKENCKITPLTGKNEFDDKIKCGHIQEITYEKLTEKSPFQIRKFIYSLIAKAKQNSQTNEERARFENFYSFTEAYFTNTKALLIDGKNEILSSINSKAVLGSVIKSSKAEGSYVLVSYSRNNYKSVYCDILDLQARGVRVVFDESLDTMAESGKKNWDERFKALLIDAEMVLCYLSEDYFKSDAVMKELKLIKEYNKKYIPIDLTGRLQASKIIESIILKEEFHLKSENVNLITDLFPDDCLTINKPPVADYSAHIEKIRNNIIEKGGDVYKYDITNAIDVNTNQVETPHALEDNLIVDNTNNIFIVADGITRKLYSNIEESISKKLTDRFCEKFKENVISELKINNGNVILTLQIAFENTLEYVNKLKTDDDIYSEAYNKEKDYYANNNYWFEEPGCVFAFGMIYNQKLYYGSVGDCGVILVRNNKQLLLTPLQTYGAFKIDNVEEERETLYEKYANVPYINNENGKHEFNEYGYGVVNGNTNAIHFFNVESIDLEIGDAVYLLSDGIYPFVASCPPTLYNELTAEEILKKHNVVTKNALLEKVDDRAIIKVKVKRAEK